jgi:hypothetical protein
MVEADHLEEEGNRLDKKQKEISDKLQLEYSKMSKQTVACLDQVETWAAECDEGE